MELQAKIDGLNYQIEQKQMVDRKQKEDNRFYIEKSEYQALKKENQNLKQGQIYIKNLVEQESEDRKKKENEYQGKI